MLKTILTLEKSGQELIPKDITGFHPDNAEGWGGPNLWRDDVASAYIDIYFNGHLYRRMDVAAQLNVSADPIIEYGSVKIGDDGIYKAFYIIDETLHDYGAVVYVHDHLRKELSKMWARLAQMTDTYRYRRYADECAFVDTHERSLNSLMRRGMEKDYLNILRITQERINTNNLKSW
jgi:hypothetical protein